MIQTGLAWASRQAASRNAAVLCTNRRSFPFAYAIARQIAEMSLDVEPVLVLESRDIAPERLLADPAIRYCVLAGTERLDGLPTLGHIPLVTYFRLLLPDAFAGEYDRILYLDSDLWPASPAISELFAADMKGHAVAMAPDPISFETEPVERKRGYRNAGVLLIDVTAALEQATMQRTIDFAKSRRDDLPLLDQDALNWALEGELGVLGPRWNFIPSDRIVHLADKIDPVIFHFQGPDKPWVPSAPPYRRAFAHRYLDRIESDFTDGEREAFETWNFDKRRGWIREYLSAQNKKRKLRRERRLLRDGKIAYLKSYRSAIKEPIAWEQVEPWVTGADIP